MPTPRRALLPRACLICGQEWTPQTSRQARENQTCSGACAKAASGASRLGSHQARITDPAGRTCRQCGHTKPHESFAWTRAGRQRHAWCRVCVSRYNAQYRARYGPSLAAEKRARYAASAPLTRHSSASRQRAHLLRRYQRAAARLQRAPGIARLVGAYFRAYAAGSLCTPQERPGLYLQARMVLAWLLRSHCWCEPADIAALLRTSEHTALWYISTVRAAIRDRHGRGAGSIGTGQEDMVRLKVHAQELLRRAEGHAPGSQEPLAQPHEHEAHAAPSDLEVYWRKRAREQERAQRYG